MAYTALCCIGFGYLSHQASEVRSSAVSTGIQFATLIAVAVGFAIVGLGPDAVRHSFQFVGKFCISFFAGGIVAILSMAFALSRGATDQSKLYLCAGWGVGFLVALGIEFQGSLRRLFKP